jgi:DNA mismatch repair ATPase MutL
MAQGAPLVSKGFTRAHQFQGMQRSRVLSCEVNSTDATEGAIMFNDPLSIEQCERLMTQLAETAFPFQCAHGRLVLSVNRSLTWSLTGDVKKLFVV